MAVDLDEARLEDRGIIAGLLDDYLCELAAHREDAVGATDSRGYPYLDAYFSEPGRHPFVIRRQGKVVGFALLRDATSTSRVWEVSEFYVTPESRRAGVGREAVVAIWRRFPGAWDLQVHAHNTGAVRFWASCVEVAARQAPRVMEVEAEDGKRLQFTFRVG